MTTTREARSLEQHGIAASRAHWNLSTAELYEQALGRDEARLAEGGPLVVSTGAHTGRAPKDKFVVREPGSEDRVWWGAVNQPISREQADALGERLRAHLAERELYVVDAFAGAHPEHRLPLRVVTQRDRVLQAARDRGVVEIAFKR